MKPSLILISILTLFLSAQTAQKLGNRADQDIQLCKNLGGGSERCLTIDSSTTTTLDATIVNQTSTGTPRNTISSPAANASWYQLGDGTNTVYFGRESDSGGTIFAGSGGDDVVIGSTTAEPVTIWTNNAKRVEIGSDGTTELSARTDGNCGIGNVCSGTYTATCTKTQGAGTCTPNNPWKFSRVGNIVNFTGSLTTDAHGTEALIVRVSGPFSATTDGDCLGTVGLTNAGRQDLAAVHVVQPVANASEPCNVFWTTISTAVNNVIINAQYDISQ